MVPPPDTMVNDIRTCKTQCKGLRHCSSNLPCSSFIRMYTSRLFPISSLPCPILHTYFTMQPQCFIHKNPCTHSIKQQFFPLSLSLSVTGVKNEQWNIIGIWQHSGSNHTRTTMRTHLTKQKTRFHRKTTTPTLVNVPLTPLAKY